jgi:hypothetical protein
MPKSFVRQRFSSGSQSAGMPDKSGSPRTTEARISLVVLPENRRLPDSISPTTAPNDQISERRSAGPPSACSGDILRRSSQNDPLLRRIAAKRTLAFVHRFGQAKVKNLHDVALAQFDIRGLQVPVNNPLLVRCFNRLKPPAWELFS